MDSEATQTIGLKGKEIDDDVQGLTPERWQRQTLYIKKRRREKNFPHWGLHQCKKFKDLMNRQKIAKKY